MEKENLLVDAVRLLGEQRIRIKKLKSRIDTILLEMESVYDLLDDEETSLENREIDIGNVIVMMRKENIRE